MGVPGGRGVPALLLALSTFLVVESPGVLWPVTTR